MNSEYNASLMLLINIIHLYDLLQRCTLHKRFVVDLLNISDILYVGALSKSRNSFKTNAKSRTRLHDENILVHTLLI